MQDIISWTERNVYVVIGAMALVAAICIALRWPTGAAVLGLLIGVLLMVKTEFNRAAEAPPKPTTP